MPAPDDFHAVLAAARAGDGAAWSRLYHDTAPVVTGYLRAQRLADPDDVAGEVFLELVRGIDRFRGDRDGFRSWAVTIAHHRVVDQRRRERRRPSTPAPPHELPLAPAGDDPEADVLARATAVEVEALLATLTDEQRTVMLLRMVADLPLKEVARITGRRVNAVKQLQHRATESLRRELARRDQPSGRSRRRLGGGRNPSAPDDAC